jgi:DNA repair protein RadC
MLRQQVRSSRAGKLLNHGEKNMKQVCEAVSAYGDSCFDAATTLMNQDAKDLSDIDLIAVLFGIEKPDARIWLQQCGGLRKIIESSTLGQALLELNSRYLLERAKRGDVLEDPDTVRAFLASRLRDLKAEQFCVLFLDNRHRVIAYEAMFQGTINSASVHPREVVRASIKHNAAAVILAHNHPSGVAEPSQSDERITQRLKESLALIDVRVLDHFVVGDSLISFAERGLL